MLKDNERRTPYGIIKFIRNMKELDEYLDEENEREKESSDDENLEEDESILLVIRDEVIKKGVALGKLPDTWKDNEDDDYSEYADYDVDADYEEDGEDENSSEKED